MQYEVGAGRKGKKIGKPIESKTGAIHLEKKIRRKDEHELRIVDSQVVEYCAAE